MKKKVVKARNPLAMQCRQMGKRVVPSKKGYNKKEERQRRFS